MNPTVAWSLLTVRSPNFPRLPRGHGGLSREDVAAMLADLERPAFLMGMAYGCGDGESLKRLRELLWLEVIMRAKHQEWRNPRPRFLCRRMAELALLEAMEPKICYSCNGKGTFTFDLKTNPEYVLSPYYGELNEHEGRMRCFTCRGSGVVKISARKRADLVGIHRYQWQQYWSSRYEPIYALTKGWLAQAKGHLDRKFREINELQSA